MVEIAASRTALGVFTREGGHLRLERHAEVMLPARPGGDQWLEDTRSALGNLRLNRRFAVPCVLVLPGHLILTRFIKVPPSTPAQREKVIGFESEQSLPVALSDLVWDTVVAAEHESELEVMMAAARLERVEALCAAAQGAGFEPRVVLPSSLATLAAFRLTCGEPPEPSVVINIGARSTTLLLVQPGRFVARTLAFGVTRPTGSGADGGPEAVATRFAQELTRTVLYFRRQGSLADPRRIYLTGGGAQLANLGEGLAGKLKLPVEHLDLPAACGVDREAAVGFRAGDQPPVVTELAGAAATQLQEGQPWLNLLPPRRRHQAGRRRQVVLALAVLLLAGASVPAFLQGRGAAGRAARAPETTASVLSPAAASPQAAPDTSISEPSVQPEAKDEFFAGVELLAVKREPYPLQLAGYFGGPDDYRVAFVTPDRPGTVLARSGHRFAELDLTLRSFEVKKIGVAHPDVWPVFEVLALAVVHDGKTGKEAVLDSRGRKPAETPAAVFRLPADGGQPRTFHEGEDFSDGMDTYRLGPIQVDPPEVVVIRQRSGEPQTDIRILRPMGAEGDIAAYDR